MIRNGVIDAQSEFAQRRYLAEIGRHFDKVKTEALDKHGIDIEICRDFYLEAGGKVFALIEGLLVNTLDGCHEIVSWDARKRGAL